MEEAETRLKRIYTEPKVEMRRWKVNDVKDEEPRWRRVMMWKMKVP